LRINKKTRKNAAVKKSRFGASLENIRHAVMVILPVIATVAVVYFIATAVKSAFPVHKVVFTGNDHLTDEELRQLAGLRGSENLLTLSSKRLYEKMLGSPWVRAVSIRKELPYSLHMRITETEPFALLDMQGRLFIVDDKGKMLEELKDSSMPFLPIISGNPFQQKEVFSEAINLAKVIKDTGVLSRKNHVEIIANKLQEIAVNLDGVVVKIGAGDYEAKLSRLTDIEEDIKPRHIPVDYIDLRFANRVVVKPVNEVVQQ
jgi:cell division protein FtsQ